VNCLCYTLWNLLLDYRANILAHLYIAIELLQLNLIKDQYSDSLRRQFVVQIPLGSWNHKIPSADEFSRFGTTAVVDLYI